MTTKSSSLEAFVEAGILRAKAFDAMKEALEPFANLGVGEGPDDEYDLAPYRILRGAIRKARAALSLSKEI
jgi:hypothetical protein